jgi:MYXO-CTERM domain-containing protein
MFKVVNPLSRRSIMSFAGTAALTAAVCMGANLAYADNAFDLQISPYARVLDAVGTPQFMDVLWEESCDNPHLRVRARNKPAFMLTNEGNVSDDDITTFSLTINEGPYLFGTGDFVTDNFNNFIKDTIYTDTGVSITSSSVSNAGKTLNVNFSGLEPGKKVIFNIDLDANDMMMFPFPDYRNVLFGAPTGPGELPTLPASYGVTFAGSSTPLSGDFVQVTMAPTYQNDDIRPYSTMDKVEITQIDGVVPEPSSGLMAAAGIAALASLRRRRRC